MSPVIDLAGVGKTYKSGSLEVEALRDVTLSIDHCEFVAVAGPSGSGKSTLMHIIGCLDVPTTGTYRLAGADVGSLREDQLADVRNRRIGFTEKINPANAIASPTYTTAEASILSDLPGH